MTMLRTVHQSSDGSLTVQLEVTGEPGKETAFIVVITHEGPDQTIERSGAIQVRELRGAVQVIGPYSTGDAQFFLNRCTVKCTGEPAREERSAMIVLTAHAARAVHNSLPARK